MEIGDGDGNGNGDGGKRMVTEMAASDEDTVVGL